MAHTEQKMRSRHERLARLRARLKEARNGDSDALRSIMLGILDLLDDEL